MPTVREIEQALFDLAPKDGAMDWDNVGQLLGDPEQAVEKSWLHWTLQRGWPTRPSRPVASSLWPITR